MYDPCVITITELSSDNSKLVGVDGNSNFRTSSPLLTSQILKKHKLQVISNASAHHVSVISGKLEVHPIISHNFSVEKNFFQRVNIFPIWCNVNFESVFTPINHAKNRENRYKINITPYWGGGGGNFY